MLELNILRCQNDTNDPTAPICASQDEIDEWVFNKDLEPNTINKRVNFKSFNQSHSEIEDSFRKIRLNMYSASGYRFLFNSYTHVDNPIWSVEKTNNFFSMRPLYHDEFGVPEKDKPTYKIAELWYHLDVSYIDHER